MPPVALAAGISLMGMVDQCPKSPGTRDRVAPLGPNKRDQAPATGVDEAGRNIVALLGRTADSAKDECARALDWRTS